MLATVGRAGYGCFLIYGSFCFAMFFFAWFFIPETKGLSLERMDDLFGVTELVKHVEEGQQTNKERDEIGLDGKRVPKHEGITHIEEVK